jgi:hypothetical protein
LTILELIYWRVVQASFAMLLLLQLAYSARANAAERTSNGEARPLLQLNGSSPASSLPKRWQPGVVSRKWKSIVLHHSSTAGGDVASIDAEHRRRKDASGKPWLGIGYHFVIGNGSGMADGSVEPTFRWRKQLAGAHAGDLKQNESGIGICLIGNFNDVEPTPRQVASVKELITALAEQYQLDRSDVVRHQDVRATECPGRKFPFDQVVAPLPLGDRVTNN